MLEMFPRHAYLDKQEYEPIGFVSVYQHKQIKNLDEAQLQEYRNACNNDAAERAAEHSNSNSEDNLDAETRDFHMHAGNRITHGLRKNEHNSLRRWLEN